MITLRRPTKKEEALGDRSRKRAILQVGTLRWHLTREEVLKLRNECNYYLHPACAPGAAKEVQ